MESDQNVFCHWVVVVSDGRTYLGHLRERKGNLVTLHEAFELRTIEIRRPSPGGQGMEVVLQNMAVQEPLCSDGVKMDLYVTKVRHFSELSDIDRYEHIKFVKMAQDTFLKQRARSIGLEVGRA